LLQHKHRPLFVAEFVGRGEDVVTVTRVKVEAFAEGGDSVLFELANDDLLSARSKQQESAARTSMVMECSGTPEWIDFLTYLFHRALIIEPAVNACRLVSKSAPRSASPFEKAPPARIFGISLGSSR
jgi:hypothetical protein